MTWHFSTPTAKDRREEERREKTMDDGRWTTYVLQWVRYKHASPMLNLTYHHDIQFILCTAYSVEKESQSQSQSQTTHNVSCGLWIVNDTDKMRKLDTVCFCVCMYFHWISPWFFSSLHLLISSTCVLASVQQSTVNSSSVLLSI